MEINRNRIVAAAKAAGLTSIDTLITPHWHGDDYGGMAELAARLPNRSFDGIDAGRRAAADQDAEALQ